MSEKFTVVNHEYFNTGGNTMVSVFNVFDHSDKTTKFVICNEEGFNWQRADTVSNSDFSLDNDEMIDAIVIGSWQWSALTSEPSYDMHTFDEEEWKMFKYCQFEYYKKDCRYFGYRASLNIDELPPEMYNVLDDDCKKWLNENTYKVETDGYTVFLPEEYTAAHQRKELQELRDFSKWLKELKYNPVGESYITIAVAGNSVKIPFHADSYDVLDTMIDKLIEEF